MNGIHSNISFISQVKHYNSYFYDASIFSCLQ